MKRYGADRDKEIQRLLQEMPEEGFRLLFDVYHMQLCVYVVQLTDSFQLAEDIVQDFFVAFWERKYYRAITGNFRSYLYTSVHNAALAEEEEAGADGITDRSPGGDSTGGCPGKGRTGTAGKRIDAEIGEITEARNSYHQSGYPGK